MGIGNWELGIANPCYSIPHSPFPTPQFLGYFKATSTFATDTSLLTGSTAT